MIADRIDVELEDVVTMPDGGIWVVRRIPVDAIEQEPPPCCWLRCALFVSFLALAVAVGALCGAL